MSTDARDLIGKIANTREKMETARRNERATEERQGDARVREAGVNLIDRASDMVEQRIESFSERRDWSRPINLQPVYDALHIWTVQVSAGAALILSVDRGRADQ